MRENNTNRFTHYLLALLGTLLLATSAFAQNAITLRGQVVDDTDAVIPGAQVTLTAKGQPRVVTTNANGEFTIPNVTPGTYQLSATFNGFQPYVQNELKIAGALAPLKLTLAIAQVAIETTVSANDQDVSTEPDKNLNATVLDEDTVQQILPDNEVRALWVVRDAITLHKGSAA